MHLIDITGAIACHRHTNALALTAGVDSLDFLHPIKVGDMIILKSRVTATFRTSLEVEVEVFSESITTGERRLTSHAFLTFVSLDADRASRSRAAAADRRARRTRSVHGRRTRGARNGWRERAEVRVGYQ